MEALAVRGEYAAVLRLYRDLRLLLHQELNAPPDSETTVLFRQIRAAAARKAADPDGWGGSARPPASAGARPDCFRGAGDLP